MLQGQQAQRAAAAMKTLANAIGERQAISGDEVLRQVISTQLSPETQESLRPYLA